MADGGLSSSGDRVPGREGTLSPDDTDLDLGMANVHSRMCHRHTWPR